MPKVRRPLRVDPFLKQRLPESRRKSSRVNNELEFDRELVINHELRITRRFADGESVEGFLLGCDIGTIPDVFAHGAMIPGYLVLRDQRSREFRAPIKLWSDRSQRRVGVPGPRVRNLLGKPDPVSSS